MITKVLAPHKLVSYEKIPTTIYGSTGEACKAVAEEIACIALNR